SEPWQPFRTRLDFEVASFMRDNHLSRPQQARLLALMRESIEKQGSFTIEDCRDLDNTWTAARTAASRGLSKHTITIPYKDENIDFDVWTRPIWDWVKELLEDRSIVSRFEWDAQQIYRKNLEQDGTRSHSRMFTEPWTADAWWETQSSLPEGGVPFCIILYADKTRLSSFGTKKGYPVYARCGNLPAEVRNGEGIAGGRLVGWLPIVPEDADKTGTRKFADFKRIVWHTAFEKMLQSMVQYTESGFFFQCGDNIERCVFPLVMILSADYEEQCVMAAIRGTNSKCPCPICLVPQEELNQLSKRYTLRTTAEMKQVYDDSQECWTQAERNTTLMKYGLRDVENVFWQLSHVNVYDAISWDRLHTYHLGLFGDHLLTEFIGIVEANNLEVRLDSELDRFPRWRGLTHFNNLAKMREFSDGRKFEDLSKILVPAAHSVFNGNRKSPGFLLLKLIRSYVMLDMYASLRCHTTETIEGAKNELRIFEQRLKDYIKSGGSDKTWIFPKMHVQIHMIMDIIRKGVTRNTNTKPNEHKHGKYKDFYQLQTNFRDTEPQILKLEHDDVFCLLVHSRINELDRWADPPPTRRNRPPVTIGTSHASVGSPVDGVFRLLDILPFCPKSLSASETPASIAAKVRSLLCNDLGRDVDFSENSLVTIYQYTKISYNSLEDLSIMTDYLRTNQEFFGAPRHDFALLQHTEQEFWYAQLTCVLGIRVNNVAHLVAIVIPCDENPTSNDNTADRISDRQLRLTRVRMRRGGNTMTAVSINTIVRGALLVQDSTCPYDDEYVVVDTMDPDFWLRHREIVSKKQLRNMRLPF
ncbi:hypothetical protein FA15DRAFT_603515, partial [Coprinopsis marcescibilis]